MKIAIIPSWYPTKNEPINGIFFKEQAKALQSHGHEVVVLYPEIWTMRMLTQSKGKTGIQIGYEDGILTYRNKGYNILPGRIPYSTANLYFNKVKKLFHTLLETGWEPDIIHAHSCLWGGWSAQKISEERDIPFIVTEHSSKFLLNSLRPYEREEVKKVLTHAKSIISVGPTLQEKLKEIVHEKEINLIPNIVNIDEFQLEKVERSNRFRFLSIAFLKPGKGMDILIRAFHKAFAGEDVELFIGGSGSELDRLNALVAELKLETQVTFLGLMSREEVKKELQETDVFALASKFETFGVVFIEALACGKPVISTASGGPEYIVNDKNGKIVPIDDIEELSRAMIEVKDNYNKFNPEEIRVDCIERFGEEAIVSKINTLYEQVIEDQHEN